MLVPGFEPGSTDRESDMMDRTTPHEPCQGEMTALFENDVNHKNAGFHFHFQYCLYAVH